LTRPQLTKVTVSVGSAVDFVVTTVMVKESPAGLISVTVAS
jgi:hypothetical protein